jgi:hypothetical protein
VLLTYLILFFAGAFTANGVPHFVKGITGEKFQTPFGRPSSAVVNVLWGSANFLAGFLLLHLALKRSYNFDWLVVVFFTGFILLGVMLSSAWSKE